ncbi:MAG: tetratricopeptide repeat protein, partial [Chitinivibrionales bacterium]|nr:tetratricopeptide repeat protein [Chitinivibrionales bacterium]
VMLYPESEWFDEALYKLAWAQYRQSNPQKAISSFLALVDLSGASTFSSALLAKESMDYIAISFSEIDVTGDKGLARALRFVNRLGSETMGAQILHRLAAIFKEQGRFPIAMETYRRLLAMFPNYKNSPLVENELVALSERGLSLAQASTAKIDFYNKYNKTGAWSKNQSDVRVRAQGDSLAENALYDGALGFHQAALQKNDTAVYQTAIDAYGKFIKAYPQSPHANECHYNMADILFSLGNYYRAAEEYMTVSKRYPDSKYRETAAWNAIVASQNLIKQETGGRKQ